jgi:hypothetical protein
MAAVPAGLLIVPFLENVNKFQNPFHHPIATTVFLIGIAVALWLGIRVALPIDKSLTLGLFEIIRIFFFFLLIPILVSI